MATKKKAPAAPVDVPAVVTSEEHNKSLARAKTSLAKKWSLTRTESLADAAQLAWSLVALGRSGEARTLVEHVSSRVVFTADPDAWWAAASAIVLAARLARLEGDEPRRASLVSRLVENPAVASSPRDALVKAVAIADKDIRSAEVESAEKWACQGFARGCARAAYFRETAADIAYEPGTLDLDALERTIAEGLAGLRAFLAR